MERLRVGFVGCYVPSWRGNGVGILETSIKELEKLAREKGFDFFPLREGVVTEVDARKARERLEDLNLDFLLIQISAFARGELIPHLAGVNARIGIWGVNENDESGPLPLNSFCGMNMYSSIMGHYLKEQRISFKWFFGRTQDRFFAHRFDLTLKALRAIKGLNGAYIGLIGGIAPGFNDMYYDERKLGAKLGVRTSRILESADVIEEAKRFDKRRVASVAKDMKAEAAEVRIDDNQVEKAARVYLALKNIAVENGYTALAISCWPKLQSEYGVAPCSSLARLAADGIVASCEGDVLSAVSMLILNYLNEKQSTVLDLVRFDEVDQAIQLWHCGPSPRKWADSRGVILDKIYNAECGVVNEMIFKPNPVTIFRLTYEGDYMLLLTGEIMETEKKSFDGSRGWVGNLKLNGEPISIKDLLNTVIVQRFEHHYVVGIGDLNDELMEFGAWPGIKPLEKVPYQNYLQLPLL